MNDTDNPLRLDSPPPTSFQEWAKGAEPKPEAPIRAQTFIGCRADGDALVLAAFSLLRQIVAAYRSKDEAAMKKLCREASRMLREFGE